MHDSNSMTIPISKNMFATVDKEDYPVISRYIWICDNKKNGITYANTCFTIGGKRIFISMHRMILGNIIIKMKRRTISGVREVFFTDHINHNGLDNRKENLRMVTPAENHANARMCKRNKSGFKGVSYTKHYKKWLAVAKDRNRKHKYIGRFDNKEDAARAYDKYVVAEWGDFALTNKKMGLLDA